MKAKRRRVEQQAFFRVQSERAVCVEERCVHDTLVDFLNGSNLGVCKYLSGDVLVVDALPFNKRGKFGGGVVQR